VSLTAARLALNAADPDPREFFEMKVRPLLARQCLACHGATKLGGLAMDSRDSLLKGGASGAAIVPEHPDDSLLIQAVRHTHARLKMPPSGPSATPHGLPCLMIAHAGAGSSAASVRAASQSSRLLNDSSLPCSCRAVARLVPETSGSR
jgi:hypothetical protein